MNISGINKIALGTVQFGLDYGVSNEKGQTSLDEIQNILEYCQQQGISMLDTAIAYGEAEKNIGQCKLDNFQVISKFILDNGDVTTLVKNSLSRLGVTQLYGYLYHRPLEANKKSWQQLQELKKQQIINKVGFSFNTLDEVKFILDKGFLPDLVQIPFNIFDNRFVEIAAELKNKYNTEIHARSTFLQGLFFIRADELDEYFQPIKNILEGLQNKYQEELADCLMRYTLTQSFVDKMVLGVNNQLQLKSNIQLLLSLSKERSLCHVSVEEKYMVPSLWKI